MSLSTVKSSEVICRSMGLAPLGVPAGKDGVCALCGAVIHVGDLQAPLSLGQAFMDDLYLAARGSQITCGWCVPCMGKEGLMTTGYGAFSTSAEPMPFRKWGDIAKALLNPPEPPFVMVYATANNQHMSWRAVVNYSKDMFYVRVGLRDLKIRRNILVDAIQDCVLLGNALEDAKALKPGKKAAASVRKTLQHPFANLSPDLKDVDHATFRPNVYKVVSEIPELQAALDRLIALTLGESWALRFVLAIAAE
jgi:CRISPR type IV-associated protein Csf1